MPRKARLILIVLMTSVMVLMVTLIATFINLGLPSDFVVQWMKAYIIAWPVAATTGYLVMPLARRLTDRILMRIDGTA
jgi:hypothetical protein